MFDWVHIELSYNASSVWFGIIVYKDQPVGQWMIIKMGYNVCVEHVVAVFSAIEVAL